MKFALPLVLLFSVACAAPGGTTPRAPVIQPKHDYVVMVSIDGLRSDALTALPAGSLPALERLMSGAYTLDARTDPEFTTTLPNHVGMLTSRFFGGEGGHRWSKNYLVLADETLHLARGEYTSGIFHVAQASGLHTAMIAAKEKFRVFPLSWNLPGDVPVLKNYYFEPDTLSGSALVADFLDSSAGVGSLCLWHIRDLDVAGHGEGQGWSMAADSEYMKALQLVDVALGNLLSHLDKYPSLRQRTAIILTSDHGGGVPLHGHWSLGLHSLNWTIPLLAWSGRGAFSGDLYELNRIVRTNPGNEMSLPGTSPPAITNADIGNLGLHILGLPPVPGSTVNVLQNLVLSP